MEPTAERVPARVVAAANDAVLWRRATAGDGDAFGTLFDRHRERVFRHACRVADTRHEAEDLVASAFFELWRRRADVRLVDSSVLPWLLVTVTNLGRNAARGTRRYRRLLDRLPRTLEEQDAAQVALEAHALGADARLRAGLDALSRADAQLIALVALEGYSVGEAAAVLDMSRPAAQARLHRARVRLREQLGDRAPGQDLEDNGGR